MCKCDRVKGNKTKGFSFVSVPLELLIFYSGSATMLKIKPEHVIKRTSFKAF